MKIERIILSVILLAFLPFTSVFAQHDGMWEELSDVSFTIEFNDEYGYDIEVPIFGPKAKALNRQEIVISGFMIPTDGAKQSSHFMLSAYPFQTCFFCGKAGPETVMEVYSKQPLEMASDKITLKGKLMLNRDNIQEMIYVLHDAVLIK